MSPPNFSPETTQVFSGYGLAFSTFASAPNPMMGAARKLERRTATVAFFNDFIICSFRTLLIIRISAVKHSIFFVEYCACFNPLQTPVLAGALPQESCDLINYGSVSPSWLCHGPARVLVTALMVSSERPGNRTRPSP